MKKRRIVIFGWAESRHIQRWASGLKSRGYEILVVSLGGEPLDHIETHIIPRTGRLTAVTAAAEAARVAREFEPDLAHVHYASTFGWWGLRSGIKPLVVSLWGSDMVSFPSSWMTRRYLRAVLSRADSLTVTSEFLRRRAEAFLPEVGNKIDHIPFGVDLPESPPALPEGPPRLCFLKAHKQASGPDILLKALAEASPHLSGVQLTLAGSGPLTEQLKATAAELKIAERVDFPGMLPHEQIYPLLKQSHLLVMPSLEEAFGVAALEASACGRPVIASDVGGVSEVVEDGRTGLLVPAGDVSLLASAIVSLIRDRGRCEEMGKAGYEFVKKNYLWERSMDLMQALYERLIDEKK